MTVPVVYAAWTPYRLTLRPPMAPGGGSWQQLDAFAEHLKALKLTDPTSSSARRAAAEVFRDRSQRYASAAPKDENTARIVDGSLSLEEFEKKAAKAPDRKEVEATASKVRDALDAQVRELLHISVQAIHEYDWLPALQALAEDALAARDQGMWSACHSFASWLRDPTHARVCALSAAMANVNQGADWWLYAVGDAGRGVVLWQAEHCPNEVVPGNVTFLPDERGQIVSVFLKPTVALPTVSDFAAHATEWGGVGLFAAEDVLVNQNRALAAQDREIDALVRSASPPENAGPKKRVFVGG